MAGTAGRVDHPHGFEAELVDGRSQGSVENELLHEDRRLQQGILLFRPLREFLVEIAEEASVVVLDLERPLQRRIIHVLHLLPPKLQQAHCRIAADADRP